MAQETQNDAPEIKALVGEERIGGDRWIDDLDPADGSVLARVACCSPDDVGRAVEVAGETFRKSWASHGPQQRGVLLRRLAELIRGAAEELARLESRDVGKPLQQARGEVEFAAHTFEFYADLTSVLHGQTIPVTPALFGYTTREPFGVTGHIVPWNYPLPLTARTIAPSLAVGNCCLVKPAEEAPLTIVRLAELALEAGFPPGVLNVLTGLGEETGAALAAHPGIGHLSFTGSTSVGRSVGRAAAENCIPVVLELGGKSPNVIFADADLEVALPTVTQAIIQNAGQTCSAGSRVVVEDSVHDAVVAGLAERFAALALGRGLDEPDLGPLVSAEQRDRVASYAERGKAEATLVLGGEAPKEEHLAAGNYFLPTLFDQVPPDSVIAQEEIFGPVLTVSSFSGVEEAREIADGTDYGLVAGVWTSDIRKAQWLARELQCGQVLVNTFGGGSAIELPFGGYKKSGHGREKGLESLHEYSRSKTVAFGIVEPPFAAPAGPA